MMGAVRGYDHDCRPGLESRAQMRDEGARNLHAVAHKGDGRGMTAAEARGWAAGFAAAVVSGLALGTVAPGQARAETMRSDSLEVDLTRRAVVMTSGSGANIEAEQVYVTMRRRDGQPIGAEDLQSYVGFAETAACKGRKVMVSLLVEASGGAGKYEVLCAGQ
jgi:hypothetical protein